MTRFSRMPFGFGLVAALLFCGCQKKQPAAPVTPTTPPAVVEQKLTAADTDHLLRLRTLALAHLENQDFAQCETTLQEIRAKLPDDLFVWQNLAICQQLAAEDIDTTRDSTAFTKAVQAAETTLGELKKRDPKNAIADLLQARVALKAQQKAAALDALRAATQTAPDLSPAWYELYQLLRESADTDLYRDPQKRAELFNAGRNLDRLAPDNWFLWKDRLVDLAKAEDPEIKPLLERMRTALQPFAATYQRDVRVNPVTLIDTALKAWDDGQKARTVPVAMTLRNILLLEAAGDKDALSRHSLDFVVTEFSTKLPAATAVTPVSTKLTFSPQNIDLPGVSLPDVRAVRSLDADIDGRADLVVLTPRRLQVFVQKDGQWTAAFGADLPGDAEAFLAADLDDDAETPVTSEKTKQVSPADPEFIVSGPGGLWVFENQLQADGTRKLELRDKDVPWAGASETTAVVLLDLDGDGDLDIFAGGPSPRWFIYRGNFLFGEVTERSQLPASKFRATAAVAVDWDRDVDVDLIVSTDEGVAWFENIRHGRFRYRDLGADWKSLADATSLNVTELNGDGAWDLVASGPEGTLMATTARSLAGSKVTRPPGISRLVEPSAKWHLVADFDNDGDVDIVTAASPPVLHRNDGVAKFSTVADAFSVTGIPQAAVAADLDRDGDVDVTFLHAGSDGQSLVARNETGNQNHWIELRPRGLQEKGSGTSSSKRVNHEAIGSLIELRVGDRYQAGIVDGQSIRFGLGQATKPDALRIIWTNGVPRAILHPAIDQVLHEEMLPIGSCPYVYVWDGERFVFYTDLLWNAPLGLKFAEDVVAGWREWEYLKIDGDRLRPRGDEYVLQITEELWEITYFDEIKLMAIDHPADVQVFTNEKVGPAEIAEPKLHTVKTPRLPIAARDPQGRDILADVRERDGHYTKTYDRKIASGLVPEHYLELDFGDLQDAQQVTLFLTGWMYPTDTSINVQFSQDPSMKGPRPPSLWAPDAEGKWREVRSFLGFPGGKTKTIAIDVSDALTPGDARLRIVTNMEFYWDHAFLTVDEPPASVREQTLSLKHADLHFRGCSQAVYQPFNGPEFYDYGAVNREPQWPALGGKFTRYGDVTPLLRERDDHLVVFGAGDEFTVTFELPKEPLPEGWVRDFVLYNVGWDKDAVLNTVTGSTVEPLPFQAMKTYANGESRPTDAAYEQYLQTYQTREQSRTSFWNQLRDGRGPDRMLPASRVQSP